MAERADVVVIGGGAFGACVTYALAKRGIRTTLIDRHLPGRATSASAGGLWAVGEALGLGCGVIFHAETGGGDSTEGPQPLPRSFMDFLCKSNEAFPKLAAEVREITAINMEVEDREGLLYLLYDETQERHADRILKWLGSDNEIARQWNRDQVLAHDPAITEDVRGAVFFAGDNQVNPMLLAEGCKRAAIELGTQCVPAKVIGFGREGQRITTVKTTGGDFVAGAYVNAAGAWAGTLAAQLGLRLPVTPVRGQILCTETLENTLVSSLSTKDCYILQKAHGEVIIGSTTEHCGFDTGVDYRNLCRLAQGAVRALPKLQSVNLKRTWAGLRPGTPDEFPVLGREPRLDNYFYATGGFRTGIVAAPFSAELVADAVAGCGDPTALQPFHVDRFESLAASP